MLVRRKSSVTLKKNILASGVKMGKYEAPQAPLRKKNGGGMQRRRRCSTQNYANDTQKVGVTGNTWLPEHNKSSPVQFGPVQSTSVESIQVLRFVETSSVLPEGKHTLHKGSKFPQEHMAMQSG